jgi:hypothetical protein
MLLHVLLHIHIVQEDFQLEQYLYDIYIQVEFFFQILNQYQLKIIILIEFLENILQVALYFPMFDELIDELMHDYILILQILIYQS